LEHDHFNRPLALLQRNFSLLDVASTLDNLELAACRTTIIHLPKAILEAFEFILDVVKSQPDYLAPLELITGVRGLLKVEI
jgi:hypothetical protein